MAPPVDTKLTQKDTSSVASRCELSPKLQKRVSDASKILPTNQNEKHTLSKPKRDYEEYSKHKKAERIQQELLEPDNQRTLDVWNQNQNDVVDHGSDSGDGLFSSTDAINSTEVVWKLSHGSRPITHRHSQ